MTTTSKRMLERLDELHPEKVDTDAFGRMSRSYDTLQETTAYISVLSDDSPECTDLNRREADELIGYLIEEAAVHMESYEAALEALNRAFPDPENVNK